MITPFDEQGELNYYALEDILEVKQIFTDGTGLTMKPP